MSNVIQFLESLGNNSASRLFSSEDYDALIATLDVEVSERQALLDRDRSALNDLLGGRPKMMCLIWSPEEEPMRKDDDQQDNEQPAEDKPPTDE